MDWNILWHQAIIHSGFGSLLTHTGDTVSFDIPVTQDGTALRFKLETLGSRSAVVERMGVIHQGKPYTLTLNGSSRLVMPPKSAVWSDELRLPLERGDTVTIRLFCSKDCPDGNAIEEWAQWYHGDAVNTLVTPPPSPMKIERQFQLFPWIPCLTEVDILSESPQQTIVAFGDSITAMSRWTKPLAARIDERFSGRVTLVNSGIGGNCLGYEPSILLKRFFGEMGTKRYLRDVAELPHVRSVILGFGINDISYMTSGNAAKWNLEKLMQAEDRMIDELHRRNLRVVGITLGPRKGCGKWNAEQEAMRRDFNGWLRTHGKLDALVDPEPLLLTPGTTDTYAPELHQGDYLHPNAAGGKIIADCFDLEQLI